MTVEAGRDWAGLLQRVRWQRAVAHEVVGNSVRARERFDQRRSAIWATRARGVGLRQLAELVRGQSAAVRLGLMGDAPWGSADAALTRPVLTRPVLARPVLARPVPVVRAMGELGPGGVVMGEPVVLVRSRVLRGRECEGRAVAAAADDLEFLMRADARRHGVIVDAVDEVRVQDGPMGAWTLVTRTATGHCR